MHINLVTALTGFNIFDSDIQPFLVVCKCWASNCLRGESGRNLAKSLVGLENNPILAVRETLRECVAELLLEPRCHQSESWGQLSLNNGMVKPALKDEVKPRVGAKKIILKPTVRACDSGRNCHELFKDRKRQDNHIFVILHQLECTRFELGVQVSLTPLVACNERKLHRQRFTHATVSCLQDRRRIPCKE